MLLKSIIKKKKVTYTLFLTGGWKEKGDDRGGFKVYMYLHAVKDCFETNVSFEVPTDILSFFIRGTTK